MPPLSAHGEAEEDVRRRRSGDDVRAFPIWGPRAPSLPSIRFSAFGTEFACLFVATEPQVYSLRSLYHRYTLKIPIKYSQNTHRIPIWLMWWYFVLGGR